MTPYYSAGGVVLYHADCRDVAATLGDGAVDLVLTDPPYDERTHEEAVTSAPGRALLGDDGFDAIPIEELRSILGTLARVCSRWLVATMAFDHAFALKAHPPAAWNFLRMGIWTKPDGTPRFQGDRPAQGWEAIAMLHRAGVGPIRWHGGGRSSVFHCSVKHPEMGIYPTAKPPKLVRQLVSLFGDEGGLLFDPFMGSGTSVLVAAERGQRAIGCDRRERACELAARRLERIARQGSLFGGGT